MLHNITPGVSAEIIAKKGKAHPRTGHEASEGE